MKVFVLLGLLSLTAWAGEPVDLGNYNGVLMTGAVIYHPMIFRGGHLSDCKLSREGGRELHTCAIQNAFFSTDGKTNEGNFDKVAVIQFSESTSYYYKGVRKISVGSKELTQAVRLTVNVSRGDTSKISGYLDLPENDVRSAFEAVPE